MDEEPFDGSSPEITEMTVRNKRLLHQLRETDYADNEGKAAHLSADVRKYRQGCLHRHRLPMRVWENIYFGNKVIVNMNCTFLDNNNIIIGNNVMIAPDVKNIYRNSFRPPCGKDAGKDMSRSVHLRHNCPTCPYRRWCMDRRRLYNPSGCDCRPKLCHRSRQCCRERYSCQFHSCRQSFPCN